TAYSRISPVFNPWFEISGLGSALPAFRNSSAAAGQRAANKFVNRSADAAEHLAKAMLVRNGLQPRAIHDLARLADEITAESPELAEAIRSLNGHTQTDHTTHYSNSPQATAESIRHAVRRLKRTGQLLAADLAHWRSAGLDSDIEPIKSIAADFRKVRAVPLDVTDSASARAVMALRSERGDALRGVDELLTAWRAPQLEPSARDNDPLPSPF
ncbi:MAG: HEPN domain-containing protein, partial [Rhodobacteraceae bacterium]|nr:HEPN domain-containing protein [Paracoccaceae bacterium]